MDRYTHINNIETFRQIHLILHPPQSLRQQPIRQLHSQVQTSVSFKPYPDLRPSLLVRDCTLKEVEHFNEKFVNYMRSGPNQIIPEGAIYSQVCVNIDNYWLTEIRERGFTKDTSLEDFIKFIDEASLFKFPLHMRNTNKLHTNIFKEMAVR